VATVLVQSSAAVGELVELSTVASAAGSLSYGSTATDQVVLTSTGTVNLPLSSVLPTISGTGVNAVNPATLFPTVGSSDGATVDPPAAGGPVLQATTDASAAPFGGQLVDVELVGLIVLFGAVIVAVVRVSLRTPRPAQPATPAAADTTAGEPRVQKTESTASPQRWRQWVRAPRLRMPWVRPRGSSGS
jgi:ABC-type amino acid transport substrate-binding protein